MARDGKLVLPTACQGMEHAREGNLDGVDFIPVVTEEPLAPIKPEFSLPNTTLDVIKGGVTIRLDASTPASRITAIVATLSFIQAMGVQIFVATKLLESAEQLVMLLAEPSATQNYERQVANLISSIVSVHIFAEQTTSVMQPACDRRLYKIVGEKCSKANTVFVGLTCVMLLVLLAFIFIHMERRIVRSFKQINEARKDAQAAERAKSEFLANMSHETRTPMNGVLGMAELLTNTDLNPKKRTFADVILKSGTALLTIINDILDFSKIDAGQMVLVPDTFNLGEAIEDVATLVSSKIAEKDLELIVRVQSDLPNHVIGDMGRIRQIVTNLMGNTVKFAEEDHVLVEVKGKTVDSIAKLRFEVSNTGIGIPEDKIDHVFQQFGQVDTTSTRRYEGTGLGLTITTRLVDLMDGEIGAHSVFGEGSTFWFEIRPAVDSEAQEQEFCPTEGVINAEVLFIDDNQVNRTIVLEQLAT